MTRVIGDPAKPFDPQDSIPAKVGDICVVHVPSAVTWIVGQVHKVDVAGNTVEIDTGAYTCNVYSQNKSVLTRRVFAPTVYAAFGTYPSIEEVEARLTPHLIPDAARAARTN